MQFSVRQLLIATFLLACTVAAAAALPTLYGAAALLVASLVLPGVLGAVAFTSQPHVKAFCLAALVPLVFGLYSVAWAVGWSVFQASEPLGLVEWLAAQGRVVKAVLLFAWACSTVAGFTSLVIFKSRCRRPSS